MLSSINDKFCEYDFVEDFLDSYVGEMEAYDMPEHFFDALLKHGAFSIPVSEFIYDAGIRKLYCKYLESFDDYYNEVTQGNFVPYKGNRYIHVVITCYKDLARQIYAELFW